MPITEDLHGIKEHINNSDSLHVEIMSNTVGFERATEIQIVISYFFTYPNAEIVRKERITHLNAGDYTLHMITLQSYYNYYKDELGKPATLSIRDNVHNKEYDTFH